MSTDSSAATRYV